MEVTKEKQTELETKANALVNQAKTFVIATSDEYTRAIRGIDAAKAYQKEVKAVWDPVCDAANTAHKAATAGRKEQMAPFLEAETILKRLCGDYDREQERIARKAEEKAREEARVKAKEEADKKLEEAATLAEEGKTEEAEAVMEEAVTVEEAEPVVAAVVKSTPKGLVYIDNWKAKVIDADKVPREHCIPDQKHLDKLAKKNEGADAPEGVEFVNERIPRR